MHKHKICCLTVMYKVCMLIFKCLEGLAPAYLVAFCTLGSAVSGRSASRSFAVAGLNCWDELLVELRDLSVGPETFAKHLKMQLFKVGFCD